MPDTNDILARWEAVCETLPKGPYYCAVGRGFSGRIWANLDPNNTIAAVNQDHFQAEELGEFFCIARTGWPAAIKALRVLMAFAEHEDSLWGDLFNPAAQALEKAKVILEGRDVK